MMMIDNKFEIGEIVFLKTDQDQKRRLITAIKICPENSFLYEITCGMDRSYHYDFEISAEEDATIKVK